MVVVSYVLSPTSDRTNRRRCSGLAEMGILTASLLQSQPHRASGFLSLKQMHRFEETPDVAGADVSEGRGGASAITTSSHG